MQENTYSGDVSLDRLSDVRQHTEAALQQFGLDEEITSSMVLVVDEWVTNIVTHGYDNSNGKLKLQIEHPPGQLTICVFDQAEPFDITELSPIELRADAPQAGGMGLELIRRLVDKIDYCQMDDWNRTCFSKTV